jgi:hypothetical protein
MTFVKQIITYCCLSLLLAGTLSRSEASSSMFDVAYDWCDRYKKPLIVGGALVTVGIGIAAAYSLYPTGSDTHDGSLCVISSLSDRPLCVSPSRDYTAQAIGLLEYNTRVAVSNIWDKFPNSDGVFFDCVKQYLCQYCGWVSKDNLGCRTPLNHVKQTLMECTERHL